MTTREWLVIVALAFLAVAGEALGLWSARDTVEAFVAIVLWKVDSLARRLAVLERTTRTVIAK